MKAQLVCDALKMAIWQRRPNAGLIHHSDRGSQYASGDYQKLLTKHGMKCSMSRKGECLDNAVAESFFETIKSERTHFADCRSRSQVKQSFFEYIEVF